MIGDIIRLSTLAKTGKDREAFYVRKFVIIVESGDKAVTDAEIAQIMKVAGED